MMPPAAEGEASRFVWFNAERISSGVRSANRPETVCVKGAGCVVTWQEDPGGIRPGEGDGPGEGWSGAVAYHETDTWYTYIDWSDFDVVSARRHLWHLPGRCHHHRRQPDRLDGRKPGWRQPCGRGAHVHPHAPDRQRHVHRR